MFSERLAWLGKLGVLLLLPFSASAESPASRSVASPLADLHTDSAALGLFGIRTFLNVAPFASNAPRLSVRSFAPNGTETRAERAPLRIDLDTSSVYGLVSQGESSQSRVGTSNGVVGFGLETPLDRGLALNLEVFRKSGNTKQTGGFMENTKAALKLHFRF